MSPISQIPHPISPPPAGPSDSSDSPSDVPASLPTSDSDAQGTGARPAADPSTADDLGQDIATDDDVDDAAAGMGLRDKGFDKAYAEEIGVGAHEDSVALFEEASQEAKDPDIKQFATGTLPTLQQHLQMAKTLKQTTGEP